MKKFLLLMSVFLVLPNQGWSFFDGSIFERTSRKVTVDIGAEDKAQVTLEYTLKNKSDDTQSFQYFFPLSKSASPKLFIDANGVSQNLITQKSARYDFLWQQAESLRNSKILALFASRYDTIFTTPEIRFTSNEEKHFKLSWTQDLQNIGNFKVGEVFFDDGLSDDRLDVYVHVKRSNIPHFFTNLPPDGLIDQTGDKLSYWYWNEGFSPTENLRFYFSENPTGQLVAKTKDQVFTGLFRPTPAPINFSKIYLWVDTSGSMSGNKWYLVQDLVELLLEHFASDDQITVNFFGKELSKYESDSSVNNRDFQRELLAHLRNKQPLGKTNGLDLSTAEIPNDALVLIITDEEEEVKLPNNNHLGVFHFEENEALAQEIALRAKGFFLPLFSSSTDIVQAGDVQAALENISAQETTPTAGFLPTKRSLENDLVPKVFVNRKFSETNNTVQHAAPTTPIEKSETLFLRREWAKYRIAQIFRDINRANGATETQVADLLWLGRNYGVSTSWFGPETTQADLQWILSRSNHRAELLTKAWYLERGNIFVPGDKARYAGSSILNWIPQERRWRAINFYDKLRNDFWVKIAPFSSAQKELLSLFPDLFSPLFAMGDAVDFCLEWKCFSVIANERTEALSSDRAFITHNYEYHWAYNYLVTLVNQQVLKPDRLGALVPDRALTRGEFANLVARYFNLITAELELSEEDFFADVTEDSAYFQAAHALRQRGIINGYGGDTFRPNQKISRAEAIKIILSLRDLQPDLDIEQQDDFKKTFADVYGWEVPWVELAYEQGLVSGHEVNKVRKLDPSRTVSVAEAAKILIESE